LIGLNYVIADLVLGSFLHLKALTACQQIWYLTSCFIAFVLKSWNCCCSNK